MKVSSISPNSWNHRLVRNKQEDKSQTVHFDKPMARVPIGYMSYPISFGSIAKVATSDKLSKIVISKLQNLQNLPCIYCGKKMIPRTAFDALSWETGSKAATTRSFLGVVSEMKNILTPEEKNIFERLKNENIDFPKMPLSELLQKIGYEKSQNLDKIINEKLSPIEYNKRVIDIITKYEDFLFPVEKNVFSEIKNYRKTNSEATLQEIMLALRPKHIKTLEQDQIKVLDEIEALANNLDKGLKGRVKNCTTRARDTIFNENSEDTFKRKNLISSLNKLKEELPNNILISEIYEKALELPNSKNSVSAFIAKYSGKVMINEQLCADAEDMNPPSFVQRSDKEIGQSLLRGAISTIEHIKPKRAYRNPKDPEMNSIADWALAHDDCNGRRDCYDLDIHLTNTPEILEGNYPQKHINFIIDDINNGELKSCEQYPLIIKKTLFRESKGLINLDVSTLKTSTNKELVNMQNLN